MQNIEPEGEAEEQEVVPRLNAKAFRYFEVNGNVVHGHPDFITGREITEAEARDICAAKRQSGPAVDGNENFSGPGVALDPRMEAIMAIIEGLSRKVDSHTNMIEEQGVRLDKVEPDARLARMIVEAMPKEGAE